MKRKPALMLFVIMAAFAIPLFAHHGNAAYNYDKKITIAGTVTEWIWANPHCWLKLDVKDDNGEVTHWILEAAAPPTIGPQGWAHNSFKTGDQVTAVVIQVKNGQPIGRFEGEVTLNGKPFPQRASSGANKGENKP